MSIKNLRSNKKWNKTISRMQLTRLLQILVILALFASALEVNTAFAESHNVQEPTVNDELLSSFRIKQRRKEGNKLFNRKLNPPTWD